MRRVVGVGRGEEGEGVEGGLMVMACERRGVVEGRMIAGAAQIVRRVSKKKWVEREGGRYMR